MSLPGLPDVIASSAGNTIGPVLMRIDRSGVLTPRWVISAMFGAPTKFRICGVDLNSLTKRSSSRALRRYAIAPRRTGASFRACAARSGGGFDPRLVFAGVQPLLAVL